MSNFSDWYIEQVSQYGLLLRSSSISSVAEIGLTLTIPGSLHAVSSNVAIVVLKKNAVDASKINTWRVEAAGSDLIIDLVIQVPPQMIRITTNTPGQCGPIVICNSPPGDSNQT